MYATAVVLSAFVAVAAGQFWVPQLMNPALGVPLETPEVALAKGLHSMAWINAAARNGHLAPTLLMRKRRDAPASEATETSETSAPAQKGKRDIIMSSVGLYPAPLAYSAPVARFAYPAPLAYSAPLALSTPLAYPYAAYPYRKRRDVSEQSAQSEETSNKGKRQLLGISGWTSPIAYPAMPRIITPPAYAVPIHTPYLLRKRRDVAEETTPQETIRQKRQFIMPALPYSGVAYPRAGWSWSSWNGYPKIWV